MLFAPPPDLPPPVDPAPAVIEQCVAQASRYYNVHPLIVYSIIDVEGGKVGTISENTDGSYDLGIMQINTIHLPDIQRQFGLSWEHVAYHPCINIGIGTWILHQRIKEAGDLWKGVGNYHSKTPSKHRIYMAKFQKAYKRRYDAFLRWWVSRGGKRSDVKGLPQ